MNKVSGKEIMLDIKLKKCKDLLQNWIDKQSHERCWYYPEIFEKLAKELGVTITVNPNLPPKEEFELGCKKYMEEQYFG